jgi:hypothetical protein
MAEQCGNCGKTLADKRALWDHLFEDHYEEVAAGVIFDFSRRVPAPPLTGRQLLIAS